MDKFFSRLMLCSVAIMASHTYAAKMCVFDLLGAQGDSYRVMKEWSLQAKKWGDDVTLKPYTDERVASEDFRAGKCDGVALTAMRAREYNKFVGSIDAIGAILNNKTAQNVIAFTLNSRNANKMVTENQRYEVIGITPIGPAYLFVNDKSINTVAKATGKKIAVLEHDQAQRKLVQQMGAQPVASDVSNFAAKFNNGQVDIVGAPAYAYKPLEIQKGVGTTGGMINLPVLMVTYDILIHPDQFSSGFGQKSRDWFTAELPKAFTSVARLDASIPAKIKMNIPQNEQLQYQKTMRDVRIALTKQGVYNKEMMSVMKRARCSVDKASFECGLSEE